MNGTDQKKLIEAGYTIIRRDNHHQPRIKIRDAPNYEWRTLEAGFASKAARDRRADELLKLSTVIED